MNKKFSTLLATLLVAGGMSSVSAIDKPEDDITKVEAGKAYQLTNGTNILTMTGSNGSYEAKFVAYGSVTDLASSLWTISYTNNAVGGPDFTLVNKGTGCPLSVDLSALVTVSDKTEKMGGSVSSWKWLDAVNNSPATTAFTSSNKKSLYSYFHSDSVVCLTVSGDKVEAVKVHKMNLPTSLLELYPASAAAYTLTAKDLNTKLGTDPNGTSFKLSATPELKVGTDGNSTLGNIFTDNTLRAWQGANLSNATAYPEGVDVADSRIWVKTSAPAVFESIYKGVAGENDGNYVLLQVVKEGEDNSPFGSKAKYLLADTAYIEGTATNLKLIAFGSDTLVSKKNSIGTFIEKAAPKRNVESYMFKFNYYPTQDSIAIFVKSYVEKATSANGNNSWWENGSVPTPDKTLVTLNKLTSSNELTILETTGKPANIKFTLGEAATNRTSKDNGVYVIKNKKGQYLAVPIYNTEAATAWAAAQWVTVDATAQDVMRMPAYQWVLVKNDSLTAEAKAISSLTITNREFENVRQNPVKLRKNEGAQYLFATEIGADSLVIEPVAAAVIADEELGYLNLDDNELKVMNYGLNYLHSYADDKYIGMMEDSVLNVKDGKISFFMEESAKANYGFMTPYVAGLKQLTRVIYTPYVKTANGDRYITIDAEKRYRMTYDKTKAQKFYLKENNFYKPTSKEAAQPYYALINVTDATATTPDSTKMGSADQDLNVILRDQVLTETRTSAFAVVPNDVPLYRRLNTKLEGAVAGAEDSTKVVKFKEYYRGEYLMDENNGKFQDKVVNYAGIERADKATGLSFYVDTVVLKGTAGHEQKPQYFIYVDRVVVNPTPGKECTEGNNHVDANGHPTDAAHCVHATPAKGGFTVAKYLVSFADSLNVKDADKLYKFGEYTRVGFVKGLHIGDSLYILTNGFEKMEASKLDTAAIRANYKATSNEKNIIDLKGKHNDEHHNYTWSFRYTNPEAAAAIEEDARRFLIESDKKDGDLDIAPTKAAWLKSQNGCLVLSDAATSVFENAKTGGDNALIFNIEMGAEDNLATDNETIATAEVAVIAGEGQVTVANAAGKKVVITNILGQVVANTVLTSDNATVAAPQGVVVVAVEGEEAVKAIVK